MPMTVPMQRGGAKSLPAELKVGGHNPVRRMQALSAGYGPWGSRIQPYFRGMRGLGQDPTNPIDVSQLPGVDLTPPGSTPGGDISVFTDPVTGQIWGTDVNGNVTAIGSPVTPVFTPVAIPTSYTGAPPAGYSGPTQVPPGVTPPSAPAGYQWASLLNSTGQTLAKVLAISQGGSSTTLPNGTQIVYGSTAGSIAGAGSTGLQAQTGVGGLSLGTLGLLAAGVVVVMMTMGRK